MPLHGSSSTAIRCTQCPRTIAINADAPDVIRRTQIAAGWWVQYWPWTFRKKYNRMMGGDWIWSNSLCPDCCAEGGRRGRPYVNQLHTFAEKTFDRAVHMKEISMRLMGTDCIDLAQQYRRKADSEFAKAFALRSYG